MIAKNQKIIVALTAHSVAGHFQQAYKLTADHIPIFTNKPKINFSLRLHDLSADKKSWPKISIIPPVYILF